MSITYRRCFRIETVYLKLEILMPEIKVKLVLTIDKKPDGEKILNCLKHFNYPCFWKTRWRKFKILCKDKDLLKMDDS